MNNLHLASHPLANEKNIIPGKNYRITVLTESLFRLEYSEEGVFNDEPTQTVLNRDFTFFVTSLGYDNTRKRQFLFFFISLYPLSFRENRVSGADIRFLLF